MLSDYNGQAPDEFWLKRAKDRIKKLYSKKFGKSNKVPYYMSPASDFGDPSDESTYTCIGYRTYVKNFSLEEIDKIYNKTKTNYEVDTAFDAAKSLSTSIISLPKCLAAFTYEVLDISTSLTNGFSRYQEFKDIEIVDCDYTGIVALYLNPEGKYAIVNKITSNSNSSYNYDWALSYNYNPANSLQYYAFPDSIGVKYP